MGEGISVAEGAVSPGITSILGVCAGAGVWRSLPAKRVRCPFTSRMQYVKTATIKWREGT